jgi:ADP-ribosylglycohydrolase
MKPRERALLSLKGLSTGDALGETFFGGPEFVLPRIESRTLPEGPCSYTDDTEMALSIVDELSENGAIDPWSLARRMARRANWDRGYGRGARELLTEVRHGGSWRHLAPSLFNGRGSYGNGAAMRIAPLGAWFADDLDKLVTQAVASAKVTHSHEDGVAGGVAIAVAAAVAYEQAEIGKLDGSALISTVIEKTPETLTKKALVEASKLPDGTTAEEAAEKLGTGGTALHSVPFCVWSAAQHLDDYEEAFWFTLRGLGDRDTTCAIVGGIVALSSRHVPNKMSSLCEALPDGFDS